MTAAYAVAAFSSAALLFAVQPLLAKRMLPALGGAPAVWSASVVCFQALLLAGHAYAHGTLRVLGPRRQRVLHAALLAGAVAALGSYAGPPDTADVRTPVSSVVAYLAAAIAFPFFVLSATSPLLQRWIATPDPYPLFAASNAGSLAALLAYPLVLEPWFGVEALAAGWRLTFAAWALGMGALALLDVRGAQAAPTGASSGRATPPSHLDVAIWLACGFIPSGLLLAVTETITADVAPVPLLWIVPLALYLLSFVLVFAPRRALDASRLAPLVPMALVPSVPIVLFRITSPIWLIAAYHLTSLLLLSLVFHGELARRRPAAEHVTAYYLALAAGGVLGGAFVTFAAPVLFTTRLEHPLLIAAACVLLPVSRPAGKWTYAAAAMLAGGVFALLSAASTHLAVANLTVGYGAFGIIALPYLLSPRRPAAFARGLAVLLLGGLALASAARPALHTSRSFYATYEVVSDRARRLRFLVHGTTVHGAQSDEPEKRHLALPYYPPKSPIAAVFAETSSASAVAILGLGAGALATYAKPRQRFVFFEIDPEIDRIARDPALFTFLSDCGDRCAVEIGDGRLRLAAQPDAAFGLIVANAFSSHAVPVHLLTTEAIDVMLAKLAPGGLATFNITNRYVDLEPLLAATAAARGLTARARDFRPEEAELPNTFVTESRWLVLARSEADLGRIASDPRWRVPRRDPSVTPWTDDRASPLAIYRWR